MKRLIVSTIAMALLVFGSLSVTPVSQAQSQCAKIQSGLITDSQGTVITPGFDKYGYNYQAHMFNGLYENFTRPAVVATSGDVNLIMKWSDAWVSNQDCNGDFRLDRGIPNPDGTWPALAGQFSRGWLTNQMEGDYEEGGILYHFTYFVKIVYVGPVTDPDPWAGARIWGTFAIIEEINNDPHAGYTGITRDFLAKPAGFGFYTN